MQRILASELLKHIDQKVMLKGWLNNIRSFGKLNFLILRDRSGLAQIILEKEEFQKLSELHPGSILRVFGKAILNQKADLGVEVVDCKVEVEVPITDTPPLEYYKPEIPTDLENILDHRPIALRNQKIQAVFHIQAEIAHAYRLFMHDEVRAVEYFPPNILGASSEGGSEFFNVDYFGFQATLAQSSQLYKQIMVGVNERVFAIVPFFRAENSHTTRHLSEGKQLEFEIGFFEHWHEILDVQEKCIKFIIQHLNKYCYIQLQQLGVEIKAPHSTPFPRLSFAEAQSIYFERTGIDERSEPDLSPAAEKDICAYALEQFGTDFVFIVDWQTSKRPFYAFPNPDNPELTNTFDLLCAGTEITSGGQRRHTYASMLAGIESKGMDADDFQDYLSIFKQGMPPHGGFGMGLERLTMTLLKLKNIREASLFPSDPKRIAGVRLKAKIFFGGENIRNEIIRLLKENKCPFQHIQHEETLTCEDSSRSRNTKMEEGIKSMILIGKTTKKNYQFNIPAHLKIDFKQVAETVGEKCEFEKAERIKKRFGLEIGAVPPFGNLLDLDTYFDQRIEQIEQAAFNCGLRTESIVMRAKDLLHLVKHEKGLFGKNS